MGTPNVKKKVAESCYFLSNHMISWNYMIIQVPAVFASSYIDSRKLLD